jgi:hypothetical protein
MKTVLLQCLLFIAVILGSASVAAAQWTTVGSAGTVDEADLAEFETASSVLRIRSTATVPATVVVRYNVVRVETMSGGSIRMTVRFRDNGSAARVRTALNQVSFITGVTTTLLTFDSDTVPPATRFTVEVVEGPCNVGFDFQNNAYYIETTLTKSATDGTPALQAIHVFAAGLCPE